MRPGLESVDEFNGGARVHVNDGVTIGNDDAHWDGGIDRHFFGANFLSTSIEVKDPEIDRQIQELWGPSKEVTYVAGGEFVKNGKLATVKSILQ